MRTTHYYTEGPVRGSCGHKHRTVNGAQLCILRDARACRAHGGYSDRLVYGRDPNTGETCMIATREIDDE